MSAALNPRLAAMSAAKLGTIGAASILYRQHNDPTQAKVWLEWGTVASDLAPRTHANPGAPILLF
jgi:hypothetical protein